MILHVTEFKSPFEKASIVDVSIPDSYKEKVDLLTRLDLEVQRETLRTGEVSQTVTNEVYGDFLFELSPSKFDQDDDLLKLLSRFNQDLYEGWVREVEEAYACYDEESSFGKDSYDNLQDGTKE